MEKETPERSEFDLVDGVKEILGNLIDMSATPRDTT